MVDREAQLLLLAACAVGLLLVAVAPDPASAVALLTRPGTDPFAPVVAAAALGSWGCAGYLVLAVGVSAGARLPGLAGHALARLARAVVPAGLRRFLGLALGVSLVGTGAVGPWAVPAAAAPAAAAVAGSADLVRLSFDWPGVSRTSAARAAAPTAPSSTPAVPQIALSPAPPAALPPDPPIGLRPAPPVVPPTALPPVPTASPGAPGTTDRSVPALRVAPAPPPPDGAGRPATRPRSQLRTSAITVQPGDTLWSLARSRLGPDAPARQVAEQWPAWWQANRAVIGEDPDLLLPGTRLVPPQT